MSFFDVSSLHFSSFFVSQRPAPAGGLRPVPREDAVRPRRRHAVPHAGDAARLRIHAPGRRGRRGRKKEDGTDGGRGAESGFPKMNE